MATYLTARRGSEREPDVPVELTAGSLRVNLVGVDLFDVQWGGTQVAQRIYVAVRDAPWNTIPGVVEQRKITQGDGRFTVTFRSRHTFGDIDFSWDGSIEGSAHGTLAYRMIGVALGDFEYSKIGLNIHHSLATYRGRGYVARASDGVMTNGRLPGLIEPQLIRDGFLTAMFNEFEQITFDLDGLSAEFEFEGDEFEMQDHRNWSDANYKTYGTPLKRGFPFAAQRGDDFHQGVALRLGPVAPSDDEDAPRTIRLIHVDGGLPRVGHLWSTAAAAAADEHGLPDSIRPDFLRVELDDLALLESTLRAAEQTFRSGVTPIELVVKTTLDDAARDAEKLNHELRRSSSAVLRVIVLEKAVGFSATKVATRGALATAFLASLRSVGCDLPVLSGSEQNFNEINRSRPRYDGLDGIAFPLNPQVHAADDVSLMQNASGVIDIIESTRALYPGAMISVGPVRLLDPHGPYPAGPAAEGESPPNVDERTGALFGAAWTVAYLRACTAAGVDATTLFPLVGAGGLLVESEDAGGPPARRAGPLAWVFERMRENGPLQNAGGLVSERTDDRLASVGWSTRGGSRILLANLLGAEVEVQLELPARSVKILLLDELVVADNIIAVDGAALPNIASSYDGMFTVTLKPFAVACLDWPGRPEIL